MCSAIQWPAAARLLPHHPTEGKNETQFKMAIFLLQIQEIKPTAPWNARAVQQIPTESTLCQGSHSHCPVVQPGNSCRTALAVTVRAREGICYFPPLLQISLFSLSVLLIVFSSLASAGDPIIAPASICNNLLFK